MTYGRPRLCRLRQYGAALRTAERVPDIHHGVDAGPGGVRQQRSAAAEAQVARPTPHRYLGLGRTLIPTSFIGKPIRRSGAVLKDAEVPGSGAVIRPFLR